MKRNQTLSCVNSPSSWIVCLVAAASLLCAGPIWSQGLVIDVGGIGTVGCQGPEDPPILTNGDLASGTISYSYDASFAELTLVVTNTTPVVPGESTAVITDIYLAMPAGVTDVNLLSQTQGSGTVAPAFSINFGNATAGCLGTFDAELTTGGGPNGGIAQAAATIFPGNPGTIAVGPVTFVMTIVAANSASLTTQSFLDAVAVSNSIGSPTVVAGMKFQGSGPEDGSGFLGSAPCLSQASSVSSPSCGLTLDPVLTITPPVLGHFTTISVNSDFPNAIGWLMASVGPVIPTPLVSIGCTVYVDFTNPVNLIQIALFVTDANGDWSVSGPVPPDLALDGLQFVFQVRLCAPNGPQGPLFPDWISNGVTVTVGCN